MLEADGLIIRNGDFRLSADLRVPTGARVAVIGPSGGGKSTFLGGLTGFLPIESGALRWKASDITDALPHERPMRILFQDHNLFPHLTLEENAALALNPRLRMSATDKAQVSAALGRVGLSGLGGRKPGELSGGQQGRGALARVLLQEKPILLLDEPFAALGPALKRELLDLVSEIAEADGLTVLMVTHDLRDAERLASQTILVADGRAHAPADTTSLLANPPQALKDYIG